MVEGGAHALEFISVSAILDGGAQEGVWCLQTEPAHGWAGGEKEETVAGLRFRDVAHRPLEVLDLTSLTVDEFTALVAPFEGAFQAHMAAWRFDGQPRGARR